MHVWAIYVCVREGLKILERSGFCLEAGGGGFFSFLFSKKHNPRAEHSIGIIAAKRHLFHLGFDLRSRHVRLRHSSFLVPACLPM